MSPMRQAQKAPSPKNILHQNKTNEKNMIAGPASMMTTTTGLQCPIPWVVAGGIGLLHVLQDDITAPRTS
jgi:hypothetical protein